MIKPSTIHFARATEEQYEAVRSMLMPRLVNELPTYLTYHNADHVKGVIRDTEYLLQKEGIAEDDKWMMLTAALFHDAGLLRVYKNHESLSCNIVREILPSFHFSSECIEAICGMIMATQLPQRPLDIYSEILCDADLFYLGTDSFFPTAKRLFLELKTLGAIQSEEEWDEKQLSFLQEHRYFTKTACRELEPKKREFIAALMTGSPDAI